MLNSRPVLWMLLSVGVLTGCQSFTGFDFDSDAIVGGGAVAGKDYITGLKPSLKAREYFVKSNANASQKKTVTPSDDQGTGVVWTDDGGIVIPPGCSIEFENKGYCLDPHLPIPGAGHEMQFVRIASLLPDELQGTYRNLLKRSAAGDEDVKNNMQRLVWALRTAGSLDVMATHLTDRQREILSECAEDGSFEDFVYRHELYGKIVEELKSKFINKIKDKTSVNVGGVVYDALDLLNPDKGKQKVEAHLQSLISMGLNLPVTQTGFNYGELENGIFTDIKGTGTLSFKAKIANSTSQPYTFYPMNYAAQVGSGGSSVGFYAAANSGMCQRGTCGVPENGRVEQDNPIIRNKGELEKRQNVAEYFNEILDEKMRDKLPNGNKLPRITPDMIVIDPSEFEGNEEMKYDADNNLFTVKDDISYSWWDWDLLVDKCVDLDPTNDGVTEVKYREKNMLHELGHFYQDKMAEMFPNDFLPPTIDDIVRAEGFAVLESARLSEDRLTLAEHDLADAKIDNEVSYLEATARYVESLPTENDNESIRELFKRTADMIRSIEDTENTEEKKELSKDVYNRLQEIPTNRLVDGIRRK